MQRILISGITAMHGWPLFELLCQHYGDSVFGICPPKGLSYFTKRSNVFACSMSDERGLADIIDRVQPTAIIHAAGMCDLDVGELEPHMAHTLNVCGTQHMLSHAGPAYFFYISADLVFSGHYPPDGGYAEDHPVDPISVVGQTYAQAEDLVRQRPGSAIVRIGLPMGPSLQGKKGAVDLIAKRLKHGKPMTLFVDEWRSAIHTDDIALGLLLLFQRQWQGLIHWGGIEPVSLYEMGDYIARTHGYDQQWIVRTSRYHDTSQLPRIGNVHLNAHKAYDVLGFKPRPWFVSRLA